MNFNVDRIAILAGLQSAGSSGVLREGAAPVAAAPAAKPPAPSAPAKTAAPAPKAPPAPPKAGAKPPVAEEDEMDEMGHMDDGAYEMSYMDDGAYEMAMDDVVYEVDEMELMEALVDMRDRRLAESKVRAQVRAEISDILNSAESGSRWLYGNRAPASSDGGKVTRGFLGPGFR